MQTILPQPDAHLTGGDSASCSACEQGRLEIFFQVDQAPILCNILCATREAALSVPRGAIRLGFCRSCGHIYNASFDPKLMNYDAAYENSLQFSPRFCDYLDALARRLIERHQLRNKQIIEIGCGQGDFLSLLSRLGGNRGTGFDPSFDPKKLDTAVAENVEIVPQLYSHEHAGRSVDLLCCRHVLEHIPRPLEFLKQLRRTLGERRDVVLFFEVPNALYTIERLGIWDIIYEHCSYFTPISLRSIFELAGFEVIALDDAFEGQFLTIEARPASPTISLPDTRALARLIDRFEDQYRTSTASWRKRLDLLGEKSELAVIWGAGSKGVTFLNVMQVTFEQLPYAVDLNSRKHGQFIVGTGQMIIAPQALRDYRPHTIIVMNGIYSSEIQQFIRSMSLEAQLCVAG